MNNYYKEMVRLADSIADKAHEGQTDRNGWPYISHPRRVALGYVACAGFRRDHPGYFFEELKGLEADRGAAAFITVEDTGVSLAYPARHFSARCGCD